MCYADFSTLSGGRKSSLHTITHVTPPWIIVFFFFKKWRGNYTICKLVRFGLMNRNGHQWKKTHQKNIDSRRISQTITSNVSFSKNTSEWHSVHYLPCIIASQLVSKHSMSCILNILRFQTSFQISWKWEKHEINARHMPTTNPTCMMRRFSDSRKKTTRARSFRLPFCNLIGCLRRMKSLFNSFFIELKSKQWS